MDDERKRDFLKIKTVLKGIPVGKFTPAQLGALMAQYSKKWMEFKEFKTEEKYADLLTPLVQ